MNITDLVEYVNADLDNPTIPLRAMSEILVPFLDECDSALCIFAFSAIGHYVKEVAIFDLGPASTHELLPGSIENVLSSIEDMPSFDVGVALVRHLREKTEKTTKP